MALDASSSCSSSAAFSAKKYDVFISFRGEDTRTNFTSHLRAAFRRKQIETYIDYRLHKGDEISASLLQAIEDSYVSVVVFSENYASSRWCLDELIHILQCKRDQGQIVIPVFYQVEPSHVRHQTGTYEQAFRKHEQDPKHNQDKVRKWKAALIDAANLVGWDSHTFRDESQLIQNIVEDILRKLKYRHLPTELNGLVGIDDNYENIKFLLKGAPTIGIWGMGGIGKTTLAKAIFVKYSPQYEGCCFLQNVRENSEKHGLDDLRYKLRSQLLQENLHVGTFAIESTFVENRLYRKKVFIVLDDVSTSEQMEYLVGGVHCFGAGSTIIITTRDKHVLSKGVDVIYEVNKLKFQKSLELFSLHAFNQSLPITGYEELSKRAIAYAKGIPLALKVLGSFLYEKSEDIWDSALRKLHKIPNENIQKVLRLSYDGLNHEERETFLDIACFLKGMDKEEIIILLDIDHRFPAIAIKTLEDKALITIKYKCVGMHDLIQEMGWEIVRQENIKKPERRSRLWDSKEIYDVLSKNKVSDGIEGMMFDMDPTNDVYLNGNTIENMTKLRFLKFHSQSFLRSCKVHLSKGLESFPEKLRYLEWYRYPLKSLPSTYSPVNLVELRMPYSHVKKIWDGVQDLGNLKVMDFTECQQLKELPDLSKALNLKKVDLTGCKNLLHIHPSVLSLQSLVRLILTGCRKLKRLRSDVDLTSLECLHVHNCLNLKELSVSVENIKVLDIRKTGIEELHPSILRLSKLEVLGLGDSTLENLPDAFFLRSLRKLCLSNSQVIECWMLHSLFDDLRSLRAVRLDNCSNLTELPKNTKRLSRLQDLTLWNCKRLRSLPKLPPSLQTLDATNCTSLMTVFTPMRCRRLAACGKYITFENCVKLDEQSLRSIVEDVRRSMIRVAYGNELYDSPDFSISRSLNCGLKTKISPKNGEVCLPGSRVPEWFRYRTTLASSITIEFPLPLLLLGFVFCVVCKFPSKKQYQAEIQCECYLGDSLRVGKTTLYHHKAIPEMNADNVHIWYHPVECHNIVKGIERSRGNYQFDTNLKVSFKFGIKLRQPGLIIMKECGVCPIYISEYLDFIGRMESNPKLEWKLGTNTKRRPQDVKKSEVRQCDEQEPLCQGPRQCEEQEQLCQGHRPCDEQEPLCQGPRQCEEQEQLCQGHRPCDEQEPLCQGPRQCEEQEQLCQGPRPCDEQEPLCQGPTVKEFLQFTGIAFLVIFVACYIQMWILSQPRIFRR